MGAVRMANVESVIRIPRARKDGQCSRRCRFLSPAIPERYCHARLGVRRDFTPATFEAAATGKHAACYPGPNCPASMMQPWVLLCMEPDREVDDGLEITEV